MLARPIRSSDLSVIERQFLAKLSDIGFGRVERILVSNGTLLLNPWPRTVRHLKLGSQEAHPRPQSEEEFLLKQPVVEFFDQIRKLSSAEILRLEVRHGLPFSLEIEDGAPLLKGNAQ